MDRITDLEVRDIRFPTSLDRDGSDAMNPDPDYSAAYVILRTDRPDGLQGHGLTFTIGRGTEIVVAAVMALRPLVVGQPLAAFTGSPGAFWKHLTGDSQLRWLGPEKGVIHLATAAVVNALWDLWAKIERKPLWKLLSGLSPAQIVELVDWRYLSDAMTPSEAQEMLDRLVSTRSARESEIIASGYPAYTTSAGWLGYSDDKIRRLCREALADGWTAFKVMVGADLEDDRRRCSIVRAEIGPDLPLMIDANQRWDVAQAIEWVQALAPCDPLWIEEPTSPDDILGHAAIARALAPFGIGVATGEHCQNRVVFKQLLQAEAISFCQIGPAARGEVRRARLPPRRRSGPLRVCPARVDLRLHLRHRVARGTDDRVRGPPARALRRPMRDPARPLPGPDGPRNQHHDEARIARGSRLSLGRSLEKTPREETLAPHTPPCASAS